MKKIKVLLIAILTIIINFSLTAQNYRANVENSKINWLGEKVTGEHDGTIKLKSGDFKIKDQKIKSAEFLIDMNSIICTDIENESLNQKLVGHLKSEDFFDVRTYSTVKIVLKEATSFSKGQCKVKALLTIKGITKPIEFKLIVKQEKEKVGLYANITVDRTLFNVRYGSGSFFDDLGDKTIYDEFKIKVNIVGEKK